MKSILLQIRANYDQMGRGERKIADYILADPRSFLPLTITQLAEKAACGTATLVRFAKRLGFSGYQELKISIAQEISTLSAENEPIASDTSCYSIFSQKLRDALIALQETRYTLDPASMDAAANKIMHAKRIVLFGLGNSAAIAHDVQHKFLRIGLNAAACSDNHMQAIIASHLDADCVAIGLSHSGRSVDVVQALHLARLNSATTICVTNHDTSPITEVSDICLYTKSNETESSILALSSRIAQLTIFDAIYTYIIANANAASKEAILRTETALKEKKY